MLVLSREEDESIIIGENIEIRVVRIDGNSVRIGINAPKEITVHRKEIYEAIRENNQQAAFNLQKQQPTSLARFAKNILISGEQS